LSEVIEIKNNSIRSYVESFQELYDDYGSDKDNAHLWFACHVAFFPAFTIDILEKIWINFREEETDEKAKSHTDINLVFPHVVIADLLNSNLCKKLGRNLFEFDSETQRVLKDFLTKSLGVEYVIQIANFIKNYKDSNPKQITSTSLRKSLEFAADLYLDRDKIAEELITYFNQVVKQKKNVSGINMSLGLIKSANQVITQSADKQTDNLVNVEHFIDGMLDIKEGKRKEGITKLKKISDFLESGLNKANKGITTLLDPDLIKELNLESAIKQNNRAIKGSGVVCILVGNNEYDDASIPSLQGAIVDIEKMQRFVMSNLKFKQIFPLRNATKEDIVKAFEELKEELVDGDILLFYYAGYGGIEVGDIKEEETFVLCSDYLKANNELNRLSHFELQHLYMQCFEKDIEIVSILDCGYVPHHGLSKNSLYPIRSLPNELNQRKKEQFVYDLNFKEGEVWEHKLTSILVAPEEDYVYDGENGSYFLDKFISIYSENISGIVSQKNSISEIENEFNKKPNETFERTTPTLKIWNYPNQNEQYVLFGKYILSGDLLVKARLKYAHSELILSNLGLKDLPENLYLLQNLTKLNLANNKLTNGLEKLLINKTEVNLPLDAIFPQRFDKLIELDVTNNPITSLEEIALLIIVCEHLKFDYKGFSRKEREFLDDLRGLSSLAFRVEKTLLHEVILKLNTNFESSDLLQIIAKNPFTVYDFKKSLVSAFKIYEKLSLNDLNNFFEDLNNRFRGNKYIEKSFRRAYLNLRKDNLFPKKDDKKLKTPRSQNKVINVTIITSITINFQIINIQLIREPIEDFNFPVSKGILKGRFHNLSLTVIEIGTEKISTAVCTERAIQRFSPNVILSVGLAGGFGQKGIKTGDVVVGTKVYDYEESINKDEHFKIRPQIYSFSSKLLELTKGISNERKERNEKYPTPENSVDISIGLICSGAKIFSSNNKSITEHIRNYFINTLAVDTDSVGFAKVLYAHPSIPSLTIRGISHLIDSNQKTNIGDNENQAIKNSSAFIFELLNNYNAKEIPKKKGFSLIVSKESAFDNSSVVVNIRAKGFIDISNLQFSINWDETKIKYKSFSSPNQKFNLTAKDVNDTQKGSFGVAWFDKEIEGVTISDDDILLQLDFEIISNRGGFVPVSIASSPTITDASTKNSTIPVNYQNGGIIISYSNLQKLKIDLKENFPNIDLTFQNLALFLSATSSLKNEVLVLKKRYDKHLNDEKKGLLDENLISRYFRRTNEDLEKLIDNIEETDLIENLIISKIKSENQDFGIKNTSINSYQFYTKEDVLALVNQYGNLSVKETAFDALMILDAPKQKTWLVNTGKQIFCLLDDEEAVKQRSFLQWKIPISSTDEIEAQNEDKEYGRLRIGPKSGWLYSRNLFPHVIDATQAIRDFVSHWVLKISKFGKENKIFGLTSTYLELYKLSEENRYTNIGTGANYKHSFIPHINIAEEGFENSHHEIAFNDGSWVMTSGRYIGNRPRIAIINGEQINLKAGIKLKEKDKILIGNTSIQLLKFNPKSISENNIHFIQELSLIFQGENGRRNKRKVRREMLNFFRKMDFNREEDNQIKTWSKEVDKLSLKFSDKKNVVNLHNLVKARVIKNIFNATETYLSYFDSYENKLDLPFEILSNMTSLNLSDLKMNGLDFSKVSLTNINFESSFLINSDFSGGFIDKCNFMNTQLDEIIFQETMIKNSRFLEANIKKGYFLNAQLSNNNFDFAFMVDSIFEGVQMKDIIFSRVDFKGSNFNSSIINNCNFNESELIDSDFQSAIISDTSFSETNLEGASFDGAKINNCDFENVTIGDGANESLRAIIKFSKERKKLLDKIKVNTIRKISENNSAILFIHGFANDSNNTWENFQELITKDKELNSFDIYELDYDTSFVPTLMGIFSTKSVLKVLGKAFEGLLSSNFYRAYDSVNIVAHSMGGLIAQRAILNIKLQNQENTKLNSLTLFGTPSNGYSKTYLVGKINNQVRDMATGSDFIIGLREDWDECIGDNPSFKFLTCAGVNDELVPMDSILKPFAEQFHILLEGDHISIIKPNSKSDLSFKVLKNQLLSNEAV